ncbi:MAG: serine/threonine protein kinase, partial [Acidobacteria bacterium]
MGVVYLARDPIIGRKLALKTFRLAYSAQDAELEQFRVRFLREAQSAGILNHPNVVTIHDVVEDQEAGAIFIAMEYVKGTDLKQLMQRHDKLPLAFVIDVVAQIAEGLDYAHRQGVVHRDVKPANIIITADKKAKITDFGIARVNASNLTVEGQLLGTPNYMAPEQVLAQEVDHRADIFSLGVMLYEMLTGQKPFAGENLTVVTNRIVNDAFTPPSELVPGLPAPLTAILGRALQKRPADRYASAADMAADLRALLKPKEGAPAPPRSTSFLTPLEPQPAAPPPAAATAGGTVVQPAVARPDSGTVAVLTPPEGGTVATPADRTTGTFVQPPPAAAQPPADAAAAGRRISPLRLAAIVVLTAVAASAAIGLGYLLVPEVDDPQGLSPEAELQRQWVPLYREGKRLLAEGRPAAAIEAFDQALAIVPENRTVRQARDEADRALLAGGDEAAQDALASRLQAAREALAGRRYQSALDLAVQVLEADPRQREAQRIKRQAEDGLARRD